MSAAWAAPRRHWPKLTVRLDIQARPSVPLDALRPASPSQPFPRPQVVIVTG